MLNNYSLKKGFTLIELLVVVAIVSLLSSIVFASLNSAREKSRQGGIKQAMIQLRNTLELNFSNSAGYDNLISNTANNWIYKQADCDTAYGAGSTAATNDPVGAAQVLPICKNLVSLANKNDTASWFTLRVGSVNALPGNPYYPVYDKNRYAITVFSHDDGTLYGTVYCMGSSGVSFNAGGYPYSTPGCLGNP